MSDKEAVEAVAAIIYEAMRFDRMDATPEWTGGNSHAENEARSKAAAAIAAARPHILEEAASIVDAIMNDAFSRSLNSKEPNRTGFRMRVETCRRIAAAIRAAKET